VVGSDLRRRWRSWLALVFLVALGAGSVMLAAADARRTDTAYARFLRFSDASEVVVSPMGTGLTGYYSALAHVPGTSVVGEEAGLTAFPVDRQGHPEVLAPPLVYMAADSSYGRTIDRPKLLLGRMPRSELANEIVVDPNAAHAYGVRIGSTLDLAVPLGAVSTGPPSLADSVVLHETVVGIVQIRTDMVGITPLDTVPFVLGTPALLNRVLPVIGGPGNLSFDAAYVHLAHHAATLRFDTVARTLAQSFPDTRGGVFVANEADQAGAVERAIRPEAIALYLFALITALTALVVVGGVASRQILVASPDHATMRGLGMSRVQLTVARLVEVAAAALVGVGLAVGASIAASPLTPLGVARLAEPSPGPEINAAVLGLGAVASVLLLLVVAGWPAWRSTGANAGKGSTEAAPSASPIAHVVARTPVTVGLGVRLGLSSGRGRSAVPVRTAIGCTAVAIVAVTTALIFGANLTRLVSTSHLYGRNWDVMMDPQSGFSSVSPEQTALLLAHRDRVVAWSFGDHGEVDVGGRQVAAIGVDPGHGSLLFPTLLEGRPPFKPDEIVLGTKTLRRTGHHVGDLVQVTIDGSRRTMRVVGRAVFPAFGQGAFTPTDLGEGAATLANDLVQPSGPSSGSYNFVLVRFADTPFKSSDVRHLGSTFAAVMGLAGCKSEACGFVTSQRPTDIAAFARIGATPGVLAAVLGVLGIGVLTQLLFLSSRRRRRDVAIFRALGLSGLQTAAVVGWQAITVALVAFVIGVPVGFAVGRWMWQLFASTLGVATSATVPPVLLLLAVPAVLLVASAVAVVPASMAGRLPTATVLRDE